MIKKCLRSNFSTPYIYNLIYIYTFYIFPVLSIFLSSLNDFSANFRETSLLANADAVRGTTTSTLHPCNLLPPNHLLASSSCPPPFPSASPRRADLLVFFLFGPLSFGLLALYSVTATFVAPRTASPFSLLLRPPLLPPPTVPPILSLSLRLCSVSPRLERFVSPFSPLALRTPFQALRSSCSFCFRRVNETLENDAEYTLGKETDGIRERNYERRERKRRGERGLARALTRERKGKGREAKYT